MNWSPGYSSKYIFIDFLKSLRMESRFRYFLPYMSYWSNLEKSNEGDEWGTRIHNPLTSVKISSISSVLWNCLKLQVMYSLLAVSQNKNFHWYARDIFRYSLQAFTKCQHGYYQGIKTHHSIKYIEILE